MPSIYKASLDKCSLKLAESRIIAGLLLDGVDAAAWNRAIIDDNVLQMRSPSAAKTYAYYIRQRLNTMQPGLWKLVHEGPIITATHAVLAAEIKHSRLLADFFIYVVHEQLRQFKTTITVKEWMEFMQSCASRDPHVLAWTPVVFNRLRQISFRILAESGYVTDTRSMTLQRVLVAPEVVRYLEENGEQDVLRCMQVTL